MPSPSKSVSWIAVCRSLGCLVGLCVLTALQQWTGGVVTASEGEPVASVTELMQAMVIPAASAIFDVPRNPPADEAAWTKVRDSAVMLAESGTLLMRAGRALDSEVWAQTSRDLAAAGEAALLAARARDLDGISDAGNQLIDSCEVCHEKHWAR